MDNLFLFLDFLSRHVILVFLLGSAVTIVLSFRKKWYFGVIIPVLSLLITYYWGTNPLPSWRINEPSMTSMNVIFWFPLTCWLFMVFVACRIIKRVRYKKQPD